MYAVLLAGSFASVYESGTYRTDVPLTSGVLNATLLQLGSTVTNAVIAGAQ